MAPTDTRTPSSSQNSASSEQDLVVVDTSDCYDTYSDTSPDVNSSESSSESSASDASGAAGSLKRRKENRQVGLPSVNDSQEAGQGHSDKRPCGSNCVLRILEIMILSGMSSLFSAERHQNHLSHVLDVTVASER